MSIIVFRDGVVAADTIAVAGFTRIPGHAAKIARLEDGRVVGACGSAAFCEAFKAWALGERDEMPEPQKQEGDHGGDVGLIFSADGRVETFETPGSYFVEPPYYAAGAGEGIAYGAFYMGATAEQAVRAVIEFDVFTGGEPTILRVGRPMTGFLATLTVQQRSEALAYTGDDHVGPVEALPA